MIDDFHFFFGLFFLYILLGLAFKENMKEKNANSFAKTNTCTQKEKRRKQ
jgi:hypothetical protein